MIAGRGFNVTVDSRDLERALNSLGNNVQNVVLDFLKKEALKWQRDIRKRILENKSVVTGDLRRSISIIPKSKWEYIVGTNLFYAPYVEYGTRRNGMRGKPYFKPIYDMNEPDFTRTMTDMLRVVLR